MTTVRVSSNTRGKTNTDWLQAVLLWLATVTTGLVAGVYFCFSVAIIPGLAESDNRTYVFAMQKINVVIENPVFFLTFFGASLFSVLTAIVFHRARQRTVSMWAIAATVLNVAAVVITMAISLPLNDTLHNAGPVDQIQNIGTLVGDFEGPWLAANAGRIITSTLALVCLAFALTARGRKRGSAT